MHMKVKVAVVWRLQDDYTERNIQIKKEIVDLLQNLLMS